MPDHPCLRRKNINFIRDSGERFLLRCWVGGVGTVITVTPSTAEMFRLRLMSLCKLKLFGHKLGLNEVLCCYSCQI